MFGLTPLTDHRCHANVPLNSATYLSSITQLGGLTLVHHLQECAVVIPFGDGNYETGNGRVAQVMSVVIGG